MGYWTKVLRKILLIVFSIFAIFLGFKLAIYYIPFLIGFIISLLIEPIIKYIQNKTKIHRKASAILVLLCIFSVLIALVTWGIISIIAESSNLLQSLNIYIEKAYNQIQGYISGLDLDTMNIPTQVINIAESGVSNFLSTITKWISSVLTSIMGGITAIPIILIYVIITILSTYFICVDRLYILDQLEHHFPKLWVKRFGKHIKEIASLLGNYLKAELILVLIAFVILLIGLYILKFIGLNIEYPLLTAIGIGFIDALPILGSGTIMIPWAIIAAINGNINLTVGILILYIVILVTRQLIEPKIVSSKIGIHPIFTLIAMYTGFRLSGIIGLFLGPIMLIILKNIFSRTIEGGVFKTILDRH